MALFSKKRRPKKIYETENVEELKVSERDEAIIELEQRRAEINRELERMMRDYARLTKNRGLKKRKYKRNPPNEWVRPKVGGTEKR